MIKFVRSAELAVCLYIIYLTITDTVHLSTLIDLSGFLCIYFYFVSFFLDVYKYNKIKDNNVLLMNKMFLLHRRESLQ